MIEKQKGTLLAFKRNVSVLCHLEVGDKVKVTGWGYKLDNKPAIVTDIKASIGCESGVMVMLDIYPQWIDSGWIKEVNGIAKE